MFDVIKFYKDYSIPIQDRGKHVTAGWVNVGCPFCKGSSHLGVHINSGAVKCWSCGKHSMISVIMALLDCDFPAAKDIHEEYNQNNRTKYNTERTRTRQKRHKTICEYPTGTGPLTERHKAYLSGRGFDAEHLEEVWGLLGTNHIGDYKFRVIAPIMVDGIMVSYQGRDITGKSELRWKACKQEDEVIEHQTIVDGLDYIHDRKAVIVEGRADTWRLGPGSICTFGIAFTLAQVNLIAERLDVAFIMFDAEEQAQKQAQELAALLSARGVEVELIDISDTPPECLVDPEKGIDPGNLQQWYADKIMKELGFK